eukprot:1155496-Pelagomonas_calceolata.AAC.1
MVFLICATISPAGQSARYFIGTAYHEHERALAAAGALSFAHEHLIGPVSGKGLQGITRGLQPGILDVGNVIGKAVRRMTRQPFVVSYCSSHHSCIQFTTPVSVTWKKGKLSGHEHCFNLKKGSDVERSYAVRQEHVPCLKERKKKKRKAM